MPSRLIWCLHRNCQIAFEAGGSPDLPHICPACEQPAHWSTDAPFPLVIWCLSKWDYALLKALKISGD